MDYDVWLLCDSCDAPVRAGDAEWFIEEWEKECGHFCQFCWTHYSPYGS